LFGSSSTQTRLPTEIPVEQRAGTVYGGKYSVTLIPGDGVGAELTTSVKTIFKAANVPVEWEQFNVSGNAGSSDVLLKQAMDSIRRNKEALKGNFKSST
jgi:isocitrate dehydrogenase (NAD+)